MQPNNPSLFVEINESSYIFMVVIQDENQKSTFENLSDSSPKVVFCDK